MGKTPCCAKEGLRRGRWTAEEDDKLKKYIEANGEGSWKSLPKNAGLLRCGKSCRLRWINYLRTDLKRGNITPQEDETILKLHTTLGNRWSLIAGHLPGRTDNEIKNYWNSHLSKKLYSSPKKNSGIPKRTTSRRRGQQPSSSIKPSILQKKNMKKAIPKEEGSQPNSIPEGPETSKPNQEEEEEEEEEEQATTTTSGLDCDDEEKKLETHNSTMKDPKLEEENWDLGSCEFTADAEKRGNGFTIVESVEWCYSDWPSSMNSSFNNNEWLNWEWEDDGVLG